ncbi:LLM class flavin-dependent oxidoreductase [Brachybacterium hainanense]|uniref:LLM class flavin-dependent oxidoreductase n=1 Tax=Brachybacterium hainanense TaxID=1541174 RepID=A0ABV6RCX5_9MICO
MTSTSTLSSPIPAPHPADAEPALPVLAVDLVTDPALAPSLAELGRGIDAAGIGAIVLSDGGLHPIHAASALAPATRRASVLARTDAVHVEPFHLATQLASLDHIAHGRSGWLVTAATDPAVPAAVGRPQLDAEQTAQEAADVLEASRLIWDSWTDDAVVRDIGSGVYVAAARLQYADFEGRTFSVRGPAITPRSPQGQVPVLVADADRAVVGEEVAAAADGRALDVPVAGLPPQRIVELVATALAEETAGATPGAEVGRIRLVRLVGLIPDADLAAVLAEVAQALRDQGLITAAPTEGASLREQLGLPRHDVVIDPARRSDRARIARGETSLFTDHVAPRQPAPATAPAAAPAPPAPEPHVEEIR